MTISILVVDDQPVVRAGVAMMIGTQPDLKVVGEAPDGLAAVGKAAGFFFWGPFGALTHAAIPPQVLPTSIDDSFRTPFTTSFSIGVQREIGKDMVVEADYYNRHMYNLLGTRESNLSFVSRAGARTFLPPFTAGAINTFGPWYSGRYDALIISFNKRMSR